MTLAAVITGDLVASRKTNAAHIGRTMAVLHHAADTTGATLDATLRFTRYRGDGWQVLIPRPGDALRAALLMQCALASTDGTLATRMALGIGTIDSAGTASLADAVGDAFTRSGHALDRMGKRRLTVDGASVTPALKAMVDLVAYVAFDWTAAQAEAMALQLQNPAARQGDIADQLGVTRQAIQLRMAAAGKSPIMAAVNAFDTHSFNASPDHD